MLAMTHHLIVQFAAYQTYGKRKSYFPYYAILGDDIVIFNTKVAKAYHRVITLLGVECNLSKSVISPSGDSLEFAKKTFYKGVNVSPIPFKEFFMSQTSISMFVEFIKTYKLNIPQALRVAGFGYKVVSGYQKPFFKLNIKVRYLILILGLSDQTFLKTLSRSLRFGYKSFLGDFTSFVISYTESI